MYTLVVRDLFTSGFAALDIEHIEVCSTLAEALEHQLSYARNYIGEDNVNDWHYDKGCVYYGSTFVYIVSFEDLIGYDELNKIVNAMNDTELEGSILNKKQFIATYKNVTTDSNLDVFYSEIKRVYRL